ncbi:hypothetical protein AB4865_09160 [Capnocytophaga sp. ARDL2]|uniref:hypothetical protein n=1 Tax=Capnocytophaga sp. ARDL2 TaxID=3238809 RepID=UPI00355825A6
MAWGAGAGMLVPFNERVGMNLGLVYIEQIYDRESTKGYKDSNLGFAVVFSFFLGQ